MNELYPMSKLSRFTDMKCPLWIQPVSADSWFWLYPFTYDNDSVVKLKFLNKSLEMVAELTSTNGQWCNWEESVDNKHTRIVINIDWWLKKFKPKYLAQYDFFMQSSFKALNKHIRSWKQAGAEYITISDKDINKTCINNYAIPTSFDLEECYQCKYRKSGVTFNAKEIKFLDICVNQSNHTRLNIPANEALVIDDVVDCEYFEQKIIEFAPHAAGQGYGIVATKTNE